MPDPEQLFLPPIVDSEDKSSQIKNRIRKNYRHLRKWAKRTKTDCFRIYDREIKMYPLAIDFYAGRFSVHYFSYDREQDEPPPELVEEIDHALCSIFGTSQEQIYWRSRVKRKKTQQYEKLAAEQEFFTVYEHGVKFKINLNDYLDTGLFLDHRETRQMVASISKDKRVLNLFAYTCSFSLFAAHAGASYTKSVDLSNTYTKWGADNFFLNSLSLETNEIVRADCMQFLATPPEKLFDIIIIDPPTLSRSKKMEQMFDIQRDHRYLIMQALKFLAPQGVIFFSTNSRKFKLDANLLDICSIEEISHKTIPQDFHNKKIHRCWKIH